MAASPEPDASPLGCTSPLPSPSSPDHSLSTTQSSPPDIALPTNASEDPSVTSPATPEDALDEDEVDEYLLQPGEVCPPVLYTFACLTYDGRWPHELRLSLSRTHPRCFLRSPEEGHSSVNSSFPPSAERSEPVDK